MNQIDRSRILTGSRVWIGLVLIAVMTGCGEKAGGPSKGEGAGVGRPVPVIERLHPAEAFAGVAFNVQTNGTSALAVTCRNATKETRIVFAGRELPTTFGGPELLSVEVPPELTERAGQMAVLLRDPAGESQAAEFRVLSR